MGPMMDDGGWGNTAVPWLVLMLVLMLVLVVVVALLVAGAAGVRRRAEAPMRHVLDGPADILRDRFARGEISGQQYREALVAVLKDRYVRGEIPLDEYEEQLDRLLADRVPGPTGVSEFR